MRGQRGGTPRKRRDGRSAGSIREGRVVGLDAKGIGVIDARPPVDVPHAFPGETVRFVEIGRGAHRVRGRLAEVVEPHPGRREAPCGQWSACRGCDWMPLGLTAQRDLKHARLLSLFGHLVSHIPAIKGQESPDHYRHRAYFTFHGRPGALIVGAYARGSHRVVDLSGCMVTHPTLLEARDEIVAVVNHFKMAAHGGRHRSGGLMHLIVQTNEEGRGVLASFVVREGQSEASAMDWEGLARMWIDGRAERGVFVSPHSGEGNAILQSTPRHVLGVRSLTMRLGRVRLELSAGAFVQVNPAMADRLYEDFSDWLSDLHGARVLDLYCGVGALGLQLGSRVVDGLGLEIASSAVEAARATARRLGAMQWRFEPCDLQEDPGGRLRSPARMGNPDVVVLNPPRRGASPLVLEHILALRPRRLVYVSCNPESLRRDLDRLTAGGARCHRFQAYDFFPHTHHIEIMAELRFEG